MNKNVSMDIVAELMRNLWVDRQTRAVLFEFTLYSPETNMFIYNVFMIELPQTGGTFKSYWIYPIRLYNHVGPTGTWALVCEVVFVIYLVVLIVKLSVRIYQQGLKYFGQFWQVFEFVILLLGVSACVIYAIKLGFITSTIRKYRSNMKLFVNFSHIVFWDELYGILLAVIAFMCTIRILEVFASSKKISIVVKVFEQCGVDLFWYGVAFLYMLLGFAFFGLFLFRPYILNYMTIYKCLTTLSQAMIGKAIFTEMDDTNPIMAKIFFIFYIITVVFFVLTIFLSILGGSIDNAVGEMKNDKNEDLMEYLFRRLASLLRLPGKTTGEVKSVCSTLSMYNSKAYKYFRLITHQSN